MAFPVKGITAPLQFAGSAVRLQHPLQTGSRAPWLPLIPEPSPPHGDSSQL